MATKTVGTLIKEARTNMGFTQEQLARKVGLGLTAADISKAERNQKSLTQEQLKKIAKLTNVTQTSLLEAAKNTKTSSAKTSSSSGKTSSSKTTTAKTPANANSTMKVTSTERKLIEYYRTATSNQKKAATKVLKGEADSYVSSIVSTTGSALGDTAQSLIGNLVESLIGGKREMPEDGSIDLTTEE